MMHCDKNRNKSMDVNDSISRRLFRFRMVMGYILQGYMFDLDSWSDIRLLEAMDKVYGNHR